MVDTGQSAPQADQASSAASPADQGGSSSPQGQPAPTSPVRAPEDDLWDRAMGKGASLREREILQELGVKSRDELKRKLSTTVQSPASDGQDYQVLARELREEAAKWRQRVDELEPQVQRYQAQSARALRSEVKALLLAEGAHEGGADDLVRLWSDRLGWSDDGSTVEVFELAPTGERRPSRLGISELVADAKKSKGYLFAARVASGAGTGHQEGASPTAASHGSGYDLQEAIRRYNKR